MKYKFRGEMDKVGAYDLGAKDEHSIKLIAWFALFIAVIFAFFWSITSLVPIIGMAISLPFLLLGSLVYDGLVVVLIMKFLGKVKIFKKIKQIRAVIATNPAKGLGGVDRKRISQMEKNIKDLTIEIETAIPFFTGYGLPILFMGTAWIPMSLGTKRDFLIFPPLISAVNRLLLISHLIDEVIFDVGDLKKSKAKKDAEAKRQQSLQQNQQKTLEQEDQERQQEEDQKRMQNILGQEQPGQADNRPGPNTDQPNEDDGKIPSSVEEIQAEQSSLNGYQVEQVWANQTAETDSNRGVSSAIQQSYERAAHLGEKTNNSSTTDKEDQIKRNMRQILGQDE